MADAASAVLSVIDYDQELSSIRVKLPDIDAANYAATMTAVAALWAGCLGIITGNLKVSHVSTREVAYGANPPSNQFAQRETKWLIRYKDNTTNEIFRNELPTADLSLLTQNSDTITDFSAGVLLAFKNAWEAIVKSPNGNAVTMISLQHVGKRL